MAAKRKRVAVVVVAGIVNHEHARVTPAVVYQIRRRHVLSIHVGALCAVVVAVKIICHAHLKIVAFGKRMFIIKTRGGYNALVSVARCEGISHVFARTEAALAAPVGLSV